MKIKYWIEVIEKSKSNYPLVDSFIQENYGQPGGYKKKSGNNEKEHCLIYLRKKGDVEKEYCCCSIRCHELLLHIAQSFHVSDEDLIRLKQKAIEYVIINGRELTRGPSPIAKDVMELVKKTELFKHYDSLS